MSTVSSTNSAINGLYSNPNQITGLVSGLDTQGMIESLVNSYSMKITSLQQDSQMAAWEQNAYQDVISLLSSFTSTFSSFSNSSTNLFSNSFFSSATSSTALGNFSEYLNVTGSTTSEVQVNSISQLATSARYESSTLSSGPSSTITGDSVNLSEESDVGLLTGDLKLTYGSTDITLTFEADDILDAYEELGYDPNSVTTDQKNEALKLAIENKLTDTTVTINGTTGTAASRIEVNLSSSGEISFSDKGTGGNSVKISSASAAIRSATGLDFSGSDDVMSIKLDSDCVLSEQQTGAEQLSGRDITFVLDGVSRTITIPSIVERSAGGYYLDGDLVDTDQLANELTNYLNDELSKIFNGDISVENLGTNGNLELEFNIKNGETSTLCITCATGEALGLSGEKTYNYLDSAITLGEFLGEDYFEGSETAIMAQGGVSYTSSAGWTDSMGNKVVEDNGQWYQVDANGEKKYGEELIINGESIGVFEADTTLSKVIAAINSNTDAGVTASVSSLTGKIVFTSTNTGAGGSIDILEGGLADDLFGNTVVGESSTTTTTYRNSLADTQLESEIADDYELNFSVGDDTYSFTPGDTGFQDYLTALSVAGEDSTQNYANFIDYVNSQMEDKGKDVVIEATNKGDDMTIVITSTQEEDVSLEMGGTTVIGNYTAEIEAYNADFTTLFDDNGTLAEETYFRFVDQSGDFIDVTMAAGMDFDTLKSALESTFGYTIDGTVDDFVIYNEDGEPLGNIYSYSNEEGLDSDALEALNPSDMTSVGELTDAYEVEKFAGSVSTKNDYNYVDGYSQGQDCEMNVTLNGVNMTIVRSSNEIDLDGLKLSLTKVFGEDDEDYEPITFETNYDTDKVVDVVQDMVDQYNELIQKVRDLYTTVPYQDSSGAAYLPLTDEDKADMSTSEIETYEEKVKTGILFGDSNMKNLYESLTSVFSGTLGAELRAIGLDTNFDISDKTTTLTLDKDKLAEMLRTDPTTVQNLFTRSTDNGDTSDGLMATLNSKINNYASTSTANKGILVRAAGTELSSLSLLDNFYQDKIDSFQEQITSWQSKLESKIDYYSAQFTRLEVLMSQMNSQSSALSQLSGGY